MVDISSTGRLPMLGNYTVLITAFSSCFADQATDHNSQRILMYYGSKDFLLRKDEPFEYP